MEGSINLTAIYVANGIGFVNAFLVLIGNKWHGSTPMKEKVSIDFILILTMLICALDCIVFAEDGQPGKFAYACVYWCNFAEFLTNIIVGPLWAIIIIGHINGQVTKFQKIFIGILLGSGFALLVANLFKPLVFSVGSDNVYRREPYYFVFSMIEYVMILDALIFYLVAKRRGGVFKFFPVWQFLIPLVLGIAIQTAFYGVSTIWPFMSIAGAGAVLGLKNETVFKDSLTGIYNRFYLDNIKQEIQTRKTGDITAMMIDLNAFKGINDRYGHAEGDLVLTSVADIILKAVGTLGSVIRYAGDEFIVLLNTQDSNKIENCINGINNGIVEYNKSNQKKYEISVAIGYCSLDFRTQTVDELLNEVDERMYDEKKKYYELNPEKKLR